MLGRNFLFVSVIVLGAGLPYLLANDQWMSSAESWWQTIQTKVGGKSAENGNGNPDHDNEENLIGKLPQNSLTAPVPTDPAADSAYPPSATGAAAYGGMGNPGRVLKLPTVVGPPGAPLEQLLRFDATPDWIKANWARVTTRVPNLNFEGWRVPLATGSTPQDIVGSITFFFDDHRNVQRITLHGYLGDASTVLALATQRFQMQRVPSRANELYLATIEGQTLGALRVSTAGIVRADAPGRRHQILMELNRTGTPYGLSWEFQRIVQRAHELAQPAPVLPAAEPSVGSSESPKL